MTDHKKSAAFFSGGHEAHFIAVKDEPACPQTGRAVRACDAGLSAGRFDFSMAAAGVRGIYEQGAPRMASSATNGHDEGGTDTAVLPKRKVVAQTRLPRMYKVVVLNDDVTPMDFVVTLLQNVFQMPVQMATEKTMEIHNTGAAVCGKYPRGIAEMKAGEVMSSAGAAGYPLKATFEPE